MVKKHMKKAKTLKVKRSMLKKGKKTGGKKTVKRSRKQTKKRGGAIGFPSRYYGATHDTSTLTTKSDLTTADPFPANTTWNSFASVSPLKSH